MRVVCPSQPALITAATPTATSNASCIMNAQMAAHKLQQQLWWQRGKNSCSQHVMILQPEKAVAKKRNSAGSGKHGTLS